MTLEDISNHLSPDRVRYCKIFKAASVRPPILEEVMPDAERMFASTAAKFTDTSCAALHHDELVGCARLKLAELIDKGELERQRTRSNFFKFLKASVQNMMRSLVQRHRFTEKRTGRKPPPRDEQLALMRAGISESPDEAASAHREWVKNVEVSIDDEDNGVQVADHSCDGESMDHVMEDFEIEMSVLERLVFRQLAEPNDLARLHAQVDSYIGKKNDAPINVRIQTRHLALGLGLDPEVFEKAVLGVKEKINARRSMTPTQEAEQQRINAAIAQLKVVFGLQIPSNAGIMLVRRMFTLAARDHYRKVDAGVEELLKIVGAAVPKMQPGNTLLRCYGVLYNKHDRLCASCGLKEACFVEASNTGLGMITISPRLLGARQVRIPVAVPRMGSDDPVKPISADDEELLAFLGETLERTVKKGVVCYTFREADTFGKKLLFSCKTDSGRLDLRFINPSDKLKAKLEENASGNAKGWSLPKGVAVTAAIKLMEQHIEESHDG